MFASVDPSGAYLPGARGRFDAKLAGLQALVAASSGRYRIASSVSDLRAAQMAGALGLVVGSEGIGHIASAPTDMVAPASRVAGYRAQGWRKTQLFYLSPGGLTNTLWLSGHAALSADGLKVVRALNREGVLIDVAHLSSTQLGSVLVEGRAPLLLSHAWPEGSMHRPIDAGQVEAAVAASGGGHGVVALMFVSTLFPGATATVDAVADQLVSFIARLGEDHVAYGGDYMPTDLTHGPYDYAPPSLADLRSLSNALAARGLSDATMRKVLGENMLNLYERAWDPTRGYSGGPARIYACGNASTSADCVAVRSHGGQGDFNHRPLSCTAAGVAGPIGLQLGYRGGQWVYWATNGFSYPCQDGSLLAVSWDDGPANAEFGLCANGATSPLCAAASSAGGSGTAAARAVNCLAAGVSGPIGLQLRYAAGKWEYYNLIPALASCVDGSTLAVRWGTGASAAAEVQLCDDKVSNPTCAAAAANLGSGTGRVRAISCYNSQPNTAAQGVVGLQLAYLGATGEGRWYYYNALGALEPCVPGSVLVVRN